MLGQEMQKKSYYSDHYTGYDFPFASLGMNKLSTAGKWEDPEYDQKEARLASYLLMHITHILKILCICIFPP